MEFNQRCADWVYETISKMDPEEQQFFSTVFVYDLWQRDVANNRRTLERISKKLEDGDREQVAKQCLHMLGHGEEMAAVAVAASFGLVSKGDWWKYQERSDDGQFGRMTGAQWRARAKEAKATGKRELADLKAAHKGRARVDTSGWPGQVDRRGQAAVGGAKTFEQGWNAKPDPNLTASQTWNRVQAGGNLASSIGAATGNTKLQAAGQAANYAGQFGPEAEKVVGPALRRSAYRYRGTERTPDKKLRGLAEDAAGEVLGDTGRGATAQTVTLADGTKRSVTQGKFDTLAPEEKVYASEQAAVRFLMGGNHKGQELKSRIPTARLSGLQRESGKITPSEGIMINSKGEITHQAVGYAEDHYLPFNLKNLSDLKGGSYVRTRESGGLTTEDIYTGLVSGARSMTVVSNSGTFTVDFDDELRGGRRYNDKAAQMVGRYAQTLDAVQSNQVENPTRALSIEDRAKIRSTELKRIEESGLNIGASDEQIDGWVKQAIERAQKQPQLSPQEIEHIDQLARRANEGDDANYERDKKSLLAEAMQDRRSRNYQLDAEGYEVALQALQEQFPYYIADVRTTTKKDDPESRKLSTKVDRGYVKAKHIRPAGARTGWYDTTIGGQKHGADTENYQNYAHRGGSKSGTPKEEKTETTAAEGVKPGESLDQAKQRMAQSGEDKQKKTRVDQAIIDDAQEYADIVRRTKPGEIRFSESSFPTVHEFMNLRDDPDQLKAFKADPEKLSALDKEMDEAARYAASQGSDWTPPKNRARVRAQSEAGKFNAAEAAKGETSPMSPPTVSFQEYQQYIGKPEVQSALGKLNQLDDNQIRDLSNKRRQELTAAKEINPGGDHTGLLASIQNLELARALKQHMGASNQPRAQAGLKPMESSGSVVPVPRVTRQDISSPSSPAASPLSGQERKTFVRYDMWQNLATKKGGPELARKIERLENQNDAGLGAEEYNRHLNDILDQSDADDDTVDELFGKLGR